MNRDFSISQATDLARHFLGRNWYAGECGYATLYLSEIGDPVARHQGASWREVFRKAGVKLPVRSRYTSHRHTVMLNDEVIATCRSGTVADRICKALNAHDPAA